MTRVTPPLPLQPINSRALCSRVISASANAQTIYGWNGARDHITKAQATKTLHLTQVGAGTLNAKFGLLDLVGY